MSVLLNAGGLTILTSVIVFLVIILILVVIILVAKAKLMPSGNVKVTINKEKELNAPMGGTLLNTLQANEIFLSSACGGGGTCGECRCRVTEGGGEILPTEKGHFTRKEQLNDWRLSRSEERRVGKECRYRWSRDDERREGMRWRER